MAGIPDTVRSMDTRSGGITEGTDAGVSIEDMSRPATRIAMTRRYDRNINRRINDSLRQRAAHRKQSV
jgi:hypothetical protein